MHGYSGDSAREDSPTLNLTFIPAKTHYGIFGICHQSILLRLLRLETRCPAYRKCPDYPG
jgi:hypothetical protein